MMLKLCNDELKNYDSSDSQDKFAVVIGEFCSQANVLVHTIETRYAEMNKLLAECRVYFAVSENSPSEEIIGLLNDFLISLQRACKENEREIEVEEKRKKIEDRRRRKSELPPETDIKKMINRSHERKILKDPSKTLKGGTLFRILREQREKEESQVRTSSKLKLSGSLLENKN